MARVVVVGAGLSGLSAARGLTRAGHDVTVIDKGRSVGGRMATRRMHNSDGHTAVVDHGAQFFTSRTAPFAELVQEWTAAGLVYEWCRGFGTDPDGHPRYAVHGGMTRLAKHLAEGLSVQTNTMAFALRPGTERGWELQLDDGAVIAADAVVMTCPLPQSYAITVSAEVAMPEALLRTEYDRTLALLAVLDEPRPSTDDGPGGRQSPDDVFSFVADNHRKGISPVPAMTFHANPHWSEEHWDRAHGDTIAMLSAAAEPYCEGRRIVATQLKRWRFATPRTIWPERFWMAAPGAEVAARAPLVLAGDAFGGPKVEGAVLSGMAAADALAAALV